MSDVPDFIPDEMVTAEQESVREEIRGLVEEAVQSLVEGGIPRSVAEQVVALEVHQMIRGGGSK